MVGRITEDTHRPDWRRIVYLGEHPLERVTKQPLKPSRAGLARAR